MIKNKKNTFQEIVYAVVSKIPKGAVLSYKEVAIKIGRPNAARAIGNALNKNMNTNKVPCHRVIRSDGSLGGYAFGVEKKKMLLESEGVVIKNGKIISSF